MSIPDGEVEEEVSTIIKAAHSQWGGQRAIVVGRGRRQAALEGHVRPHRLPSRHTHDSGGYHDAMRAPTLCHFAALEVARRVLWIDRTLQGHDPLVGVARMHPKHGGYRDDARRRSLMITGAAAADGGSGGGSAWAAETPIRYPEPAKVCSTRAFSHMCWATRRSSASPAAAVLPRGPWFGDGRYLLWSDIPNDRI